MHLFALKFSGFVFFDQNDSKASVMTSIGDVKYPNIKGLRDIASLKSKALKTDGVIAKNTIPIELSVEEARLAVKVGLDLAALRKQTVIKFDTKRFKFQEAVAEALGLPVDMSNKLGSLHNVAMPGDSRGSGYRGYGTEWIKRWKSDFQYSHKQFKEFYLALLKEVVLSYVNDPGGICFQRDPTFRCHIAGDPQPTGRVHCDSDYGHSSAEINFWLPISSVVSGANTLYCESAPGVGDYTSFDYSYGDLVSFWGSQCNHYTVPNTTNVTRVSLDFRVLPRSLYDLTDSPKSHFAIGGFFGHMYINSVGDVVIQ